MVYLKDETEEEVEEDKKEAKAVDEEEEEEQLDTFDMEITITEPFKKGTNFSQMMALCLLLAMLD